MVDRLIIREGIARRLTDSLETATSLSGGIVVVDLVGEGRDLMFSLNYACDDCGISIEEMQPRMFSSTTCSALARSAPVLAHSSR